MIQLSDSGPDGPLVSKPSTFADGHHGAFDSTT